MSKRDFRPGIFWTWQDRQVEDRSAVTEAVADMVAHGFGKLLVQPRGCRYSVDDPLFVKAVTYASAEVSRHGAELWLHLDPRSLARSIVDQGGASNFLIVAGTGEEHKESPLDVRPIDIEVPLGDNGAFEMRLNYPATRPYHVHSDGAIRFAPNRLERCFAYRLNDAGVLVTGSVQDITTHAHLFTNEIEGYVEVFGRWQAPGGEGWRVLAATSFSSNYPDFASSITRAHLRDVVDGYASAGAGLAGLWWDEPGYCTGFDRRFRADRGRLPWSASLLQRYRTRTGREALDDLPYLLRESDDGRWGSVREQFYVTVQDAVFSAQQDLLAHARDRLGDSVRMGVHQTWHQNADDVINGCADWWDGRSVLEAGYSDVGDAERVKDPRQMAEVRAMASIAVSLGRHSASGESYYNLWGVDYGESADQPGGEIVDWWVDLQAAIGCNWLAHTYGPTGYFERPSAWGPGYPNHPTWPRMTAAADRLARVHELAEGRAPDSDVAFVYPLGTMYRLGSDLANPLSDGTHVLIDVLLRAGYELDIVSPEMLRSVEPGRYRAILYSHPFGATPEDVDALRRWQEHGTQVIAHGLPAVAGHGYAGAEAWSAACVSMPELDWNDVRSAEAEAGVQLFGHDRDYAATEGWGRPVWSDTKLGQREGGIGYVPLFLHALGEAAVDILAALGLEPSWRPPRGAVASRTALTGGGVLLRLAPAEFQVPFEGELALGDITLKVGSCRGLLAVEILPDGGIGKVIAPDEVSWDLRNMKVTL